MRPSSLVVRLVARAGFRSPWARSMRAGLTALALLPLWAGCPSYNLIPDADRAQLEEAHQGSLLYLRQSVYVGDFYDDDRYKLIHPRKFEELTYLESIEGEAITPPRAEGIIPAGTRVRVEALEWPTGEAVFRRPLYTPRYTTWIWLRIALDRGPDITLERDKRHILLLPGGIRDAETFDLWFDAALSKEDPNPWLLSLPKEQQRAIARKQAVPGMSYDALTTALGFPDNLTRDVIDGRTVEVGVWGAVSVVLHDGVVQSVRDPAATSNPSDGRAPKQPPASAAPQPSSAPNPQPSVDPAPAGLGPAEQAPTEPPSAEPPPSEPPPLEPESEEPASGIEPEGDAASFER